MKRKIIVYLFYELYGNIRKRRKESRIILGFIRALPWLGIDSIREMSEGGIKAKRGNLNSQYLKHFRLI